MIRNFFARSELTRNLWDLRTEFLWVLALSMIANLLMLAPTVYMLQIYDRVLISRSLFSLAALTILLLWFFFIIAFSEWLRSRLLVRIGLEFDEQLSGLVFRQGFRANLKMPGYQSSEALSDLINIRQFITGNGVLAFCDLPWTPFYIFVVFILHPFLGFMSILFVLIQLSVAIFSHAKTRSPLQEGQNSNIEDNRLITNKLRNLDTIKAMGMQNNLYLYWGKVHRVAIEKNAIAGDLQQRHQAFSKFIRYVMQSFTLGAAALLVIRGELSAGAMIAANVLVSRSLQPIDIMIGTYKQLISAKTAFTKLETLLADRETGRLLEAIPEGKLKVEDLHATVPNTEKEILRGVNLEFSEGKLTAIVGQSGSGKSTLARCIIGVWPYFQGRVSIGNMRIQEWDREFLGISLGYLPQDVQLIDGSIAENICRFGKTDTEKIINAAKAAGIHEMILRMPQGYDTQVGNAGGQLSGGQRQRIGLARAVYGEPDYIVLDEPNSNLDDAGEKSLLELLNELKSKKKTVIAVTHRLSFMNVVDDLVLLEDGLVMAHGPQEEIVKILQSRQK